MKRIFSLILVCLLAVPSSMMAAQAAAPAQNAPISAWHSWFTSLRSPTRQAQQLIAAAEEGHVNTVKELLAVPGIDANAQGDCGYTALIYAAEEGHENIVRMLLAAPGIDVNVKSNDGETALLFAARHGDKDIVKELIEADAEVNARNRDGQTVLDIAVKKGHQNIAAMIRDVVPKKARSFMFAYKKSRETATSDPDPERQTRLGDLPPEIVKVIAEQVLGKSSADRND